LIRTSARPICGDLQVWHWYFQHAGGLTVSTVILSELYAGAYKHPDPDRLLALIADLLPEVTVLDFDQACARQFGRIKGELLKKGVSIPDMDLMIAAVALVHNLTLVTNNTADFRNIPGLRLEDWLTP